MFITQRDPRPQFHTKCIEKTASPTWQIAFFEFPTANYSTEINCRRNVAMNESGQKWELFYEGTLISPWAVRVYMDSCNRKN